MYLQAARAGRDVVPAPLPQRNLLRQHGNWFFYPKRRGVLEFWTLELTMMHSSSKACINSSTKRIYFGSTWYGRTTIKQQKKGSFWWRGLLKLIDSYKGMASAKPLSGSLVYLWNDVWNGTLPKCIYPELFFICYE
jgi:hypothetical protein